VGKIILKKTSNIAPKIPPNHNISYQDEQKTSTRNSLTIHPNIIPNGISNTSSTILIEHHATDPDSDRPSSIRTTISPNDDDISVHKRHPRQFQKQQTMISVL
jgi:hypothetical protein